MSAPAANASKATESAPMRPRRGLFMWILDLFSSVRFGILLMVLLFIYMSVGSAGLVYPTHPNIFSSDNWIHQQIRQWPVFEMTEFEWFHWWPFDLLLGLISLTMVVTTLRRIKLSVMNLGVWFIHLGIIILIVGSLIYFGTKVEGDTFLPRRTITVEILGEDGVPLGPAKRLSVFSGNRVIVDFGNERYEIMVASTDPEWELLTGENAGDRAYSVSVFVRGAERSFVRQLIAGYPDYTEDLVSTDDPTQPFQRAVKVTGDPIIEPRLSMKLEYAPQDWFYLSNQLSKNWALYLREKGTTDWVERPIPVAVPLAGGNRGLPLYGDHVADPAGIFSGGRRVPDADPLDVVVEPVASDDPLPGVALRLDSYLRYALMQTRWEEGTPEDPVNPMAELTISIPGQDPSTRRLVALDPEQSSTEGGAIAFRVVDSEEAFERLLSPPSLRVRLPGLDFEETRQVDQLPPTAVWLVGDTGYRLVLSNVQNDIVFASGSSSVAFVDITTPDEVSFRRWVFSDPDLTRDLTDEGGTPLPDAPPLRDEELLIDYIPGGGSALITLVAGPEPDQLRVIRATTDGSMESSSIEVGGDITFGGGVSVTLTDYMDHALLKSAPFIVPPNQRQREAGNLLSWVRMVLPSGDEQWLRYHRYLFPDGTERLSRFDFDPTPLSIRDAEGKEREIEVVFSRRRHRLPSDMVLERFEVDSNIGGFTGETGSIRDYRSLVRFLEGSEWSDPSPISMNKPVEHDGFWFFQSQWDPPEPARSENDLGSRGLNYTVLGVGNRNGVYTQLVGCGIAVFGMLYAFYVKPEIKRRRRRRLQSMVEEQSS